MRMVWQKHKIHGRTVNLGMQADTYGDELLLAWMAKAILELSSEKETNSCIRIQLANGKTIQFGDPGDNDGEAWKQRVKEPV